MDLRNYGKEEIFHLEVDEVAKTTMLEMSRWTKFMAILGFVFLGLMVVGGIFAGIALSMTNTGNPVFDTIGGVGFMAIYLVLAAVEFYPIYALLKYSTTIKQALHTANKDQFNKALRYQKNMFKYIGILTIVIIGVYGLFFVVLAVTTGMRMGR